MSSYMEAGFGNFCGHFGVTDHLMQQVIFHLQTEQPWNVLQCIFTFVIWTSPTLSLNRSPLWRIFFLTEKTCLHLHVSLQLCASCSGVQWWFMAFSRYNKYLLYLPTHKERQQQMLNAGDSDCMWGWTEKLNLFQSLYVWQLIKNRIRRLVCGSDIPRMKNTFLNFHFLLICITVIL